MAYKDPERQREYQRLWMARRREDYFRGKVCVVCGTSENLELDHIDPSTKVTHNVWSWAKDRREAELAKCQPLCTECHKAKTAAGRRPDHADQHGTRYQYNTLGCKCEECRAWNRAKKAAQRASSRNA